MSNERSISGFSKLSKRGKLKWIVENFFKDPERVMKELKSYWLPDEEKQKILDGISENTITNFHLPFGVAPNFLINGKTYCVPMVIEESSVVAAASSAAKFWLNRGGFRTKVLGTEKIGQIHFTYQGDPASLQELLPDIKNRLMSDSADLAKRMVSRGGGVTQIDLRTLHPNIPNCHQLMVKFETADSMGANFINSVLERMRDSLLRFAGSHPILTKGKLEVVMAILSNLTPDCRVHAEVRCPISHLPQSNLLSSSQFAEKFQMAVAIAKEDPYRATTHNKGIYNGIDAVILATGNDFRAVEACGHAYAAQTGQYRSLSDCRIEGDQFVFWLEVPLAVGTVGGLTSLHPMARRSLELLEHPSALELMEIAAAVGLAQNFGALRSLITDGIQRGHMRMHLSNILTHLEATEKEAAEALAHFRDKAISHQAVQEYLALLRT